MSKRQKTCLQIIAKVPQSNNRNKILLHKDLYKMIIDFSLKNNEKFPETLHSIALTCTWFAAIVRTRTTVTLQEIPFDNVSVWENRLNITRPLKTKHHKCSMWRWFN